MGGLLYKLSYSQDASPTNQDYHHRSLRYWKVTDSSENKS